MIRTNVCNKLNAEGGGINGWVLEAEPKLMTYTAHGANNKKALPNVNRYVKISFL